MKKLIYIACIIGGALNSYAQIQLPEGMEEISGLELIDDSTFVAINDSGNKPEVILFNLNGEKQNTISIENAKNVDWEDVTFDGESIYVGDIGNNRNRRKDLCIYKIDAKNLHKVNSISAEKIQYSYPEQVTFPPDQSNMFFDAEALAYKNDSLWIFTKVNDEPWSGKTHVYTLPTTPGNYKAAKYTELFIGPDGWYIDAITGADFYGDSAYLITYNRINVFNFAKKTPNRVKEIGFEQMTQKEAIVVKDKDTIYIADEKHRLLGGGLLYKMKQ